VVSRHTGVAAGLDRAELPAVKVVEEVACAGGGHLARRGESLKICSLFKT
jgi:hypothetical protein